MKISATMRKPGMVCVILTGKTGYDQPWLINFMRVSVTIGLLLICTLQVLLAATVKGQDIRTERVMVRLDNESLLAGIKQIEEQSAFRFYYRKADVQAISGLKLSADTRTVEHTLLELLRNTSFSFRQIDQAILLEKHPPQTAYTIKGRVTTADHRPVELATVRLLKAGSQKITSTTLADTGGRFTLLVYEKGDYLLKASSVETDSAAVPVTIADTPLIQLPDIILQQAPRQLNTVNIRASRPLIRQEADRIAYDLQADPQSKVSSVLDMMRKVPYLSLDGDENILLRGSSGYRIFINGKPSAMVERNPKEVLRSIPASTIKSIEVITTPPSKYDAEGLAGIINIITNKEVGNGYHGSMNVSEKGPVGGPGGGGAFTYKEGKFGLSALAGISRNNVPEMSGELIRSATGINPTLLNQHSTGKTDGHTGYAGLELSYELDSLNLLSGQLNWNDSKANGLATQTSLLTGAATQGYTLRNDNGSKGKGVDAALNYQLGFKANKDQLLTFSYRYMKNTGSLYNNIGLADELNYNSPDYHQSNAESLSEHTVQIDYVQPIGKVSMEAGFKGIFRTNKSDFRYNSQDPVSGQFNLDPSRSNIFNNQQEVLAAYNSYAYQTADWQFKAGLRAEETIISGDYSQGSEQVQQRYLNVVPAIVVNRKFKDRSSLSVSFSTRVQRPAIAQLNPFVDRSNPNFQTTGNPELRPITSNAFQLSYLKSAKATVNIALGYLYFNRVINPISAYDPATGITLTRYENYGKGRVLKTNIYINYPLTAHWNLSLNSDLRHVSFYAIIGDSTLKNAGFMAYANLSSGYSFSHGWRANADFTMNTGGVSRPQGKTNGFTASTFSVNKDIVSNKLTLSAAVSNPFTKYRYTNERITGPDFLQTNNTQSYYRKFTVSLNYRFGKLKDEIKKNKRGIKNDDLAN